MLNEGYNFDKLIFLSHSLPSKDGSECFTTIRAGDSSGGVVVLHTARAVTSLTPRIDSCSPV